MSLIHVLDKSVYDLIAAGEVADRPASVLKELVENAIDSGANTIVVETKQGGKTYMRVTDNGCGISEEDIPMAFVKHATSKIVKFDDLQALSTLGFRGEALPSIAAVSRIELLTKRAEDEFGHHYTLGGDDEPVLEPAGCPNGTTIIVRDLFYNTPARMKFMRTDTGEGSAVSSLLQKLALSHPEISFKLIKDNKTEFVTPGDGKPLSAIYHVLGKEFHDSCIEVDYEYLGVKVFGYVTKPELSKSNHGYQYYFVNSRYVRATCCLAAVDEGYRNRIMQNKVPGCVLFLTINPALVDFNADPKKTDVRFQNDKDVYSAVYFAVSNALIKDTKPVEYRMELKYEKPAHIVAAHEKAAAESAKSFEKAQKNDMSSKPIDYKYTEGGSYVSMADSIRDQMKLFNISTGPMISSDAEKNDSPADEMLGGFKHINKSSLQKREEPETPAEPEYVMPPIKVVGEIFKTYIICECGADMLLIDKHAAHERLIFERVKHQVEKIEMQYLVENHHMTVTHEMFNEIVERDADCQRLGFGIQPLIAPQIAVYGVPATLQDEDPEVLISKLTECFLKGKNNAGEEIFDDIYHSIACKAAIKANSDTNQIELEKLVELVTEEDVRYCPHGRPILIKLTKRELEKMFKRLV